MGIFEDITRMQGEGRSDQDITLQLQQAGYGIKEISDSLSQSKIKQAVSQEQPSMSQAQYSGDMMMQSIANQSQSTQATPQPQTDDQSYTQQYSQAQQQDFQTPVQEYAAPEYTQQYSQAQQVAPQSQQGQQYQQYSSYDESSSSSDLITEIAEQVMTEKLSQIRKQLEFIIDLKNTTDAKILSIDERLKRLEKMIDKIQLSILQKVGEYVTNVEDIKKEMVENQKSFKSLLASKGHKTEYKQL